MTFAAIEPADSLHEPDSLPTHRSGRWIRSLNIMKSVFNWKRFFLFISASNKKKRLSSAVVSLTSNAFFDFDLISSRNHSVFQRRGGFVWTFLSRWFQKTVRSIRWKLAWDRKMERYFCHRETRRRKDKLSCIVVVVVREDQSDKIRKFDMFEKSNFSRNHRGWLFSKMRLKNAISKNVFGIL